jgi:SAM-dependent methyltransferase
MNDYSGTGNLEVMDDAINYNAHLLNFVRTYAGPTDRILDFGAGIGTFSIPLKGEGWNVECVETDPSQLQRIIEQGAQGFSNLNEVPDEIYDYIYTLNVLEHIEDDQAALLNLFSKLKPGGRLLIYVPAFQLLFTSMDRAVGHFRRYTLKELSEQIKSAGFEVKEARYVDSIGFIASLVFKYVGSKDGSLNRNAVILFDRLAFPVSLLLDLITKKLFGKNLLIVAVRP